MAVFKNLRKGVERYLRQAIVEREESLRDDVDDTGYRYSECCGRVIAYEQVLRMIDAQLLGRIK
jgi:hypothetical protein